MGIRNPGAGRSKPVSADELARIGEEIAARFKSQGTGQIPHPVGPVPPDELARMLEAITARIRGDVGASQIIDLNPGGVAWKISYET